MDTPPSATPLSAPTLHAPRSTSHLAPLTRLRIHDVFMLEGRLHRVDLVNECRARCVPITRRPVSYVPQTGPDAGKTVAFGRQDNYVSICPNAEMDILGRWDPARSVVVFPSDGARPHDCDPQQPESASEPGVSQPAPAADDLIQTTLL